MNIKSLNTMTINLIVLAIGIYIIVFEAAFQIHTGWGANITVLGAGSILMSTYYRNLNQENKAKLDESFPEIERDINYKVSRYIKKSIIIGVLLIIIITIYNINKYM